MRKLLLASAATLSAAVGVTGIAAAQTQTVTTAPAAFPVGVMGVPAQPQPQLGGNNRLNSDGAPPPANMVAPGSVTLHFNGRINWYGYVAGGSGYTNTVTVPNPNGPGTVSATNKLNPYGTIGYMRLYPGMDGMATNGLRYGAIAEIRQNFGGVTTSASSGPNAASAASSGNTLYVRRAAVYMGSNTVGLVKIGLIDGPFSSWLGPTTTEGFNDGAWNGDLPGAIPSNVGVTWPFWDVGNEYDVNRIVYLSPSFWGFDASASFAPSNYGFGGAANSGCAVASGTCGAASSVADFTLSGRPTNWYEAMLRYRGNFAGAGIYAIAGYSGSGTVNSSVGQGQLFNGLGVGTAGLALTYAGFTLAGNVLWGAFNGSVQPKPQGGANALAWVAGLQYATGPIVVGASWFNFQSQGAVSRVGLSQRNENGLAVGATYTPAPGLDIYLSYLYGERTQGGYNFITATPGAANNAVHAQAFSLGGRVRW